MTTRKLTPQEVDMLMKQKAGEKEPSLKTLKDRPDPIKPESVKAPAGPTRKNGQKDDKKVDADELTTEMVLEKTIL